MFIFQERPERAIYDPRKAAERRMGGAKSEAPISKNGKSDDKSLVD